MTHNNKMVAVLKVNGQVLREMCGSVYLPFNSEYSILLKNLNSKRARVKISIDNEDILNGSGLIVEPNSDFELKRWLVGSDKTGPALKFIEKTQEIRDQRGENSGMDGIVRIEFQYEADFCFPQQTIWHDGWRQEYNPWKQWDQKTVFYTSPATYGTIQNASIADGAVQSKSTVGQTYNSNTTLRSADVSHLLNEDGMTVKGEEVDQEFTDGCLGVLDSQVNVITLNLKGGVFKDNKPITVKTKIECSKCGKLNSWNSNFCSLCGNNLKY